MFIVYELIISLVMFLRLVKAMLFEGDQDASEYYLEQQVGHISEWELAKAN